MNKTKKYTSLKKRMCEQVIYNFLKVRQRKEDLAAQKQQKDEKLNTSRG
jgi:hypothetical protein